MRCQLISPRESKYSAIQQILINRGISIDKIDEYLNTTDNCINSYEDFNIEILHKAADVLLTSISNNKKVLIIVDCDCDGYTSSALLINYLYDIAPSWVTNNLFWYLHSGKQHGLNDCIEEILINDYNLVILVDAGSNDFEYHKKLKDNNTTCIVLDHHESDKISEDAIIINNQLSDYKNKNLSGVGVTWQFCRYLDSLGNTRFADEYLDLVALGNCADMMSLLNLETKHLINKGFQKENIKNPLIYGFTEKDKFHLDGDITHMKAAFYIAPFVNAIVRSGTMEEKQLVFNSMLKFKAFEEILSTKRGHKLNEMETVLSQALRTCTNVKNRQTKIVDNAMTFLEEQIDKNNLLEHKTLIFRIDPGILEKEVLGLCANKIMAKYQKPCCILTKVENEGVISYQGSARGCDKTGIITFKDICEGTGLTQYAAGHQSAFGLSVLQEDFNKFIDILDITLDNINGEPVYLVDFIYNNNDISSEDIIEIGKNEKLWGSRMDEPLIEISNLVVSQDMVTLMSEDKNPTLKITLPNGISLIKFKSSKEESQLFTIDRKINVVGKCNVNYWNGNTYPQILIEDWEVLQDVGWIF